MDARNAGLGLLHRIGAGLLAAGSLGILAVSAALTPAAAGHGTHVALGMPPCGWAAVFDAPCPTCGMTTACAYAADGRFLSAITAQPFGFLLALGAATGFWGALHVAATGSRIGPVCGKLLTPTVLWTVTGLAFGAWAYKYATWPGA